MIPNCEGKDGYISRPLSCQMSSQCKVLIIQLLVYTPLGSGISTTRTTCVYCPQEVNMLNHRSMNYATTRQTKHIPKSPWGRTRVQQVSYLTSLLPKPFPFSPTISSLSTFAIPTIGVVPLPKIQANSTSAVVHPLLSAISLTR